MNPAGETAGAAPWPLLAADAVLGQIEAGVMCPTTMTYASIPALRRQPEIAAADSKRRPRRFFQDYRLSQLTKCTAKD